MIDNVTYKNSLGKSDHLMLSFDFVIYSGNKLENKQTLKPKVNFYKGDYESIREALETADIVIDNLNTEDAWTKLSKSLLALADKFIPTTKPKPRGSQPYTSKEARDTIKKKGTSWKKYQHCKTADNFRKYQRHRNSASNAIRKSKINYEKDLAAKIKTNPKLFWSYVKSNTKTNSNINRVYNSTGVLTSKDLETVECMNDFFVSVFNEGRSDIVPPQLQERKFNCPLSDVTIAEADFRKQFSS